MPDGDMVLVLCESFQEIPDERRISEWIAKDGGRVFFAINLAGCDYFIQTQRVGGHIDTVSEARKWRYDRVLEYLNRYGAIRFRTSCPEDVFAEFINGAGEKNIGSAKRQEKYRIGEFTLPPLDDLFKSDALGNNVERLPRREFENSMRDLFDAGRIDEGLFVVTPNPQSSLEYDGIVFHLTEDSQKTFFQYFADCDLGRRTDDLVPPSIRGKADFPNLGYNYMRLGWIPFAGDSKELLSAFTNPVLTQDRLMDCLYFAGDIALAYKYYRFGAVFIFYRDAKGYLKFIRVK
jgi:hypothetical protein